MKILIAITTGRKSFKNTLDILVKNFLLFGHFKDNYIGAIINYDQSFLEHRDEDFNYNTELSKHFDEIIYLGMRHVKHYIKIMKKYGIDEEIAYLLSQSTGYSNKKNLVYLEALNKSYDIILFWDDDEYPFVCNLKSKTLNWVQTDILGAHLMAYKDFSADAAFGFYTGYASPIPRNFSQIIRKSTARGLGTALSIASDVICSTTFLNTNKIFVGLKNTHMKTYEIKFINGGKWISGGNLSINVGAVRSCVIPPFYAPSGTRADDTILSMGLRRAKVMHVPSGIFHDAFGEYEGMTSNCFYSQVVRNPINSNQINRFCNALKGWLGYAPIFLRIKYGRSYRKSINVMMDRIKLIDGALMIDLPELKKILGNKYASELFAFFADKAEKDYKIMKKCYEEWKKISQ